MPFKSKSKGDTSTIGTPMKYELANIIFADLYVIGKFVKIND